MGKWEIVRRKERDEWETKLSVIGCHKLGKKKLIGGASFGTAFP